MSSARKLKKKTKCVRLWVLQVRAGSTVHTHTPFLNILLCDWLRRDVPGTGDAPPWKAVEVKLAADRRVRAARVGNVVAVKGHHVTCDVTAGGGVCETRNKDCFGFVHIICYGRTDTAFLQNKIEYKNLSTT